MFDSSHINQDLFNNYFTLNAPENARRSNLRRCKAALRDVYHIFNFDTYLLDAYFQEVTVESTRLLFRLVLKFGIFLVLCDSFNLTSRRGIMEINNLRNIELIYIIGFIIYMYTFRQKKYEVYSFVATAVSIMLLLYASSISDPNNIAHDVTLVGILFVFLPIRPQVIIAMFFLHLITSETSDFIFYEQRIKNQTTSNKGEKYDWFGTLSVSTIPAGYLSHFMKRSLYAFAIYFIALYIGFWSRLRQRTAFLRICLTIYLEHQTKEFLSSCTHWIDAIMPTSVSREYLRMRRVSIQNGDAWFYSEQFDSVSILFGDIVGFTRMSSNKTAAQVLHLLNDLFNSFDKLCDENNCEKIGTLGDCYYCVAGCPKPRYDHAECCTEMGLGMCRAIKRFNSKHREDLNMRIGVHSGRVNAAIIGKQRFRYDIFSHDVAIANLMESSGLPGRVHISGVTFELIKTKYRVAAGEDIVIKAESSSGLGGMVLGKTKMKTYFVDPKSSNYYQSVHNFGRSQRESVVIGTYGLRTVSGATNRTGQLFRQKVKETNRVTAICRYVTQISMVMKNPSQVRNTVIKCENMRPRQDKQELHHRVMGLIKELRLDPENRMNVFISLPTSFMTLHFKDKLLEWEYQTAFGSAVHPLQVDSLLLTGLFDVYVMSTVMVHVLLISILYLLEHSAFDIFIILQLSTELGIIVIACTVITLCTVRIQSMRSDNTPRSKVYAVITHPLFKEVAFSFLSLLPTIHLLFIIMHYLVPEHPSKWLVRFFNNLKDLVILIHMAPLSTSALVRFAICGSSCIIVAYLDNQLHPSLQASCHNWLHVKEGYVGDSTVFSLLYYLIELIIIYQITRTHEQVCRLSFYVNRETQLSQEKTTKSCKEVQNLLYNIIPCYVLESLLSRSMSAEDSAVKYATSLPNAGVAFVSITDFFSLYYREDYKGGQAALKLLNSIICAFEKILSDPIFVDVEKIKTINDCYMVASGLNATKFGLLSRERSHLLALMDYCFLLLDAMKEFNADYLIGPEQFQLKIGYNCGPVIAGIIGSRKPMYDIWGDTVNVASRMYSTGHVSVIQVPKRVRKRLKKHYNFRSLGKIFVKGKGKMRTFACTQKGYL